MSDDAVKVILECLPVVMEGMYRRVVSPVPFSDRLPTSANRRFEAARTKLRRVVDEIIADCQRAGVDRGDLMSGLIFSGQGENDDQLSPIKIHDHVMNFLMAATETSATALAWLFYELDRNPRVQQQVHAEVDALPADWSPGTADADVVLPATDRAINEVLRLYPPGWMMTRVTSADTELAGRLLPAGTIIVFSTFALHRDPSLFDQPDRFDPDRWLPDPASEVVKGSMIPFGGGPRRCIGDNFATAEAMLGAVAIARRWRLVGAGGVIRPRPRALTAMGPLPMTTQPRQPAAVNPAPVPTG